MAADIGKHILFNERLEDGSYGAYVPDLPGCIAAGDTPEEAECHIREAVPVHL
jgi:predicted RNase H-like HicB family nuclease